MMVVERSTSASPSDELGHHFFEVVCVHLAVADDECARGGRSVLQFREHGVDGGHAIVQERKTCAAAMEFARCQMASRMSRSSYCRGDGLDGQGGRGAGSGWCSCTARAGEREVERAAELAWRSA